MASNFAIASDIPTYLQVVAVATLTPVYFVTVFGLAEADSAQPRHALCIATRNSLIVGGCFYIVFVIYLWAYVRYMRTPPKDQAADTAKQRNYERALTVASVAVVVHAMLYIHDRSFVAGYMHCSLDVRGADEVLVRFGTLAGLRQVSAATWFLAEFVAKEILEGDKKKRRGASWSNRRARCSAWCGRIWPLVCVAYLVLSPLVAIYASQQSACGGWTRLTDSGAAALGNGTAVRRCNSVDTDRALATFALDIANLAGLAGMQAYLRAYATSANLATFLTIGGNGARVVLH